MPRGGKNHAQGGEKIAQGGEKFSRALRARRTVYFFPPLANFICTPLFPNTLILRDAETFALCKICLFTFISTIINHFAYDGHFHKQIIAK